MVITNISEAKAHLSKLIEQVLQGQEIIIGKAGKPVAKLVPFDTDAQPRQLGNGAWRGQLWVADDFDEPMEEITNLFAGQDEHELAP